MTCISLHPKNYYESIYLLPIHHPRTSTPPPIPLHISHSGQMETNVTNLQGGPLLVINEVITTISVITLLIGVDLQLVGAHLVDFL